MKITIKRNEEGIAFKADKEMGFDTAMELLITATLAVMNDFASKVPEEHRQKVKEAIYDNYNESASSLLDTFMPDKELRPDLTEEAIRRLEDEIMTDEIAKYNEKKKKKGKVN